MHAWNFTPSSFQLIIQDLNEMKFIELGIASFHMTLGFEFFVSLRKDHPGQVKPRIDMLRNIAEELCGPGDLIASGSKPGL